MPFTISRRGRGTPAPEASLAALLGVLTQQSPSAASAAEMSLTWALPVAASQPQTPQSAVWQALPGKCWTVGEGPTLLTLSPHSSPGRNTASWLVGPCLMEKKLSKKVSRLQLTGLPH